MSDDKKITRLLAAGISGVLFIILLLLVRNVDVAPIGPEGTSIGLSHINGAFRDITGTHLFWYTLTQIMGILALIVAGAFAAIGVLQLIKRKSLAKVDCNILCLGGLYLVTLGLYIFFEKVIVNYRPMIMPDGEGPEASFPSSHTMLICVVIGSAMMILPQYLDDRRGGRIIRAVCLIIIGVTVFGRLICGVHWFTDILAGVLLSYTLLMLFESITKKAET